MLEQLKSSLKRTIKWNKYEPTVTVKQRNRYLDFLISFQGVNTLFVLSFENNVGRTSYTRYYFPLVEIKDYNVVIDGGNFFDKPIKNNLITYDNIRKIATGQWDDYTNGCQLHYLILFDCDPEVIQQISFTANLDQDGNSTMFFIIEEAQETILDFSQGTVKVL